MSWNQIRIVRVRDDRQVERMRRAFKHRGDTVDIANSFVPLFEVDRRKTADYLGTRFQRGMALEFLRRFDHRVLA